MKLFLLILLCAPLTLALSCSKSATWTIAESIPIGLDLKTLNTTYEAWMNLLQSAQHSIDMSAFYMTLTDGDDYPHSDGGWMGRNIYQQFYDAHSRGVQIRMVISQPGQVSNDSDARQLAKDGVADVRFIDWGKIMEGGILHTKMIIVDGVSVYIGSANADWRSLAQVKELGLVVENCAVVAEDADKVFETYWIAAEKNATPPVWPTSVDTQYNSKNPMEVTLSGEDMDIWIAAAPDAFDPPGRESGTDAITSAMNEAEESLCIEVMDYCPCTLYEDPNFYWPDIDDAFRNASYRGVKLRLLFAKWPYTDNHTIQYIKSLNTLDNVEVRWFEVPKMPPPAVYVPYTRVNHAKWLVTEKSAYITTSNWSADYFLNTGGTSFNVRNAPNFLKHAQEIFDRDWNSQYTSPVDC